MEQIEQQDLKQGTTYNLRDRKGNFQGTLLTDPDEGDFAEIRIISGKAMFLSEADKGRGQIVNVRFSQCRFYQIDPPDSGGAS